MNKKPRKRIGYSSSVRGLQNQSNASLDDKLENERIRSNSGKSIISPISTASTKGHQKKNSSVTNNNKYRKYVYDRKYAEKPSSLKELKDKHNFANKESGYVNNFKKPDLDIETKKERIKMLNLNLKGNYGQKFSMKKI